MTNKELSARKWAEQKGVSYKQILRWLADLKIRKSKFPGAHQMQHRGTWFIPANEPAKELAQPLTAEAIVIEDERKQAVLKHHHDLRAVTNRWKSELWLPPPWRWDVAHLEFVFYVDTEKSQGHFRHFGEGDIHWMVQDDGSIVLKLLVEDEATFSHLKVHTQDSAVWGLFAKWKEEGGIYILLCSSLLARIEQDAKKAIGAKSGLSWWTIYHDAFCVKDTQYRCETCATENPSAFICPSCDSKFSQVKELELHIRNNHLGVDPKAWPLPHCQNCRLPLGWLRPILREYESTTEGSQSTPIHIHGYGNIEESVSVDKFRDIVPAHKELVRKYRGCDLVETILEREKEVKQVEIHLSQELVSLSQQKAFHGKCGGCQS